MSRFRTTPDFQHFLAYRTILNGSCGNPKLDQPLDFVVPPLATADAEATPSIEPLICPHCQGKLIFIRTLSPRQAMAP
jgi:hypothetical protein